jgi:ketosteroid isomerase-like protein
MNQQLIQEIIEAESQRRAALIADDHEAINRLFTDDLVYVHTTGMVHDKTEYLAYARNVVRYLNVERGALEVRVHGDVAVMTGYQINTLQKRGEDTPVRGEGFVTQVWLKGSDGWQMTSFHGSRLPQ